MINKLYGVLRGSCVIPQDTLGYRYSDYTASDRQLELLKTLLPNECDKRAIMIDYLISLLSGSFWFPRFISEFDQNNTYDVSCIPCTEQSMMAASETLKGELSINILLQDWDRKVSVMHERFPYKDNDPFYDRVAAKLFAVAAM